MIWRFPLRNLQTWCNLCQIHWCRQDLDECGMSSGRTLPAQWQLDLASKSSVAAHSSPHFCKRARSVWTSCVQLKRFFQFSCYLRSAAGIGIGVPSLWRAPRPAQLFTRRSHTLGQQQENAGLFWLSRVAWIWDRYLYDSLFIEVYFIPNWTDWWNNYP
jgi:hypothetical protein